MIVRCPDCRTKYEIAADAVPEDGFKLRCPRCKAVFPVSLGIEGRSPLAAPVSNAGARPDAPAPPADPPPPPVANPVVRRELTLPDPEPERKPVAPPPSRSRPRVTDPSLARRMARAMISEMVLNRRSERDAALRSGTVLRRFGSAIVSAHEAYRARVSPELVPAPRIFRDAINEILGEGHPLL